ncbi:MAG: hypothetical protein ACE5G3_04695 [Gammaproteobacteria bacterium]
MIDPGWEGTVQFYELVFGTWLIYGFLVLMWERVLRERLPEWKYVLITFLGASFFWINHYFQQAPFYAWLLNGYTLVFLIVYFRVCVRNRPRSVAWKIAATLSAVAFTVAFIGFEMTSRFLVEGVGWHEFWPMLIAYFGYLGLIAWRARATAA